jgi:hypothetical protein
MEISEERAKDLARIAYELYELTGALLVLMPTSEPVWSRLRALCYAEMRLEDNGTPILREGSDA